MKKMTAAVVHALADYRTFLALADAAHFKLDLYI